MTQPFESFYNEEFRNWLAEGAKKPESNTARSLNNDRLVVLRCHKAKPFAQVEGVAVHMPPPNMVVRQGPGDR
jgi:hypothetical protein